MLINVKAFMFQLQKATFAPELFRSYSLLTGAEKNGHAYCICIDYRLLGMDFHNTYKK